MSQELSGYQTVLEGLLEEAVEENIDQLLMISRSDLAHIYFLSNGRVKKGILFEKDITRAIVERFSGPEPAEFQSEQLGRRFLFSCEKTPDGIGECVSLKIQEIKESGSDDQ